MTILRLQLGVSTYMDYDMKEQLTAFFTPESITLPVLHNTYCNPQDIPWEVWRGKLADLLTNKSLRKGRLLWLYTPKDADSLDGSYRYCFLTHYFWYHTRYKAGERKLSNFFTKATTFNF